MNIKENNMFLKRICIVVPLLGLLIHNNKLKIFLGLSILFVVFIVIIARYTKKFTFENINKR